MSRYGSRSVHTDYGTQTAGGATFVSAGSDAWNAFYLGKPLAYSVARVNSIRCLCYGPPTTLWGIPGWEETGFLFALVLLPSLPPSLDLLLGLGQLDMGLYCHRGVKLLPLSPLLLGLDIDQWEWDLDHLRVDPQPAPKKKKL